MQLNTQRLLPLFLVAITFGGGAWKVLKIREDTRLDRVLNQYDIRFGTFDSANYGIHEVSPNGLRLSKRFTKLWAERRKTDNIEELAPYLFPSEEGLNYTAFITLHWFGQAENPKALPALRRALKENKRNWPLEAAEIGLCIGRIEARNLKGQARLEAIANSIGLTWEDIGKMSQRMYAKSNNGVTYPQPWIPSTAYYIYDTFIEALYDMGKKNEDISLLKKQLFLGPHAEVRLSCATLSGKQELDYLFKYLDSQLAVSNEVNYVTEYLIGLGRPAEDKIAARLQAMIDNPGKYRKGRAYIILFDALRELNPGRLKPLRNKLKKDKDPWLAHYA